MRVGINATSLNNRPSGARQRFIGLYGALFSANPGNQYLIYEPNDCRVANWFSELPNVRGIATLLSSTDRWQRLLRGFVYWPRRLAKDRLDLFEALHLPLTRAPDCPTLLTVHDARPVLPDVPWIRRMLYRQVLRRSLRGAVHVVTVSDTMRAELMAIEPSARVTTVYNGIDPSRIAPPPARAAAEKPHLPANYVLAVGHFEARKNYPALLAAMTSLRASHPGLGLLIVGKDGGTYSETAALVDQLGLGSIVRLLTEVDDDALANLYRGAQMLVFPSTYEGFGIPLLEAMAAGCPLALSDLPVFRELSEDQSSYFNPHDPGSIAATIADLLASPTRQDAQRAYGRRRINDFAFATLADQLARLHRRLAGAATDARPCAVGTCPDSEGSKMLTPERPAARKRRR